MVRGGELRVEGGVMEGEELRKCERVLGRGGGGDNRMLGWGIREGG